MTISHDLISVQPIDNPDPNSLFHFYYKYPSKFLIYPFTVTKENINQFLKEFVEYDAHKFKNELIQNDIIDKWEIGGPLSGRGGFTLTRDGVEIERIFTWMS